MWCISLAPNKSLTVEDLENKPLSPLTICAAKYAESEGAAEFGVVSLCGNPKVQNASESSAAYISAKYETTPFSFILRISRSIFVSGEEEYLPVRIDITNHLPT